MYALKMQTACQSEGSGEPDDPSSHHQEPVRPPAQDCSSFDIVRATQVFISTYNYQLIPNIIIFNYLKILLSG